MALLMSTASLRQARFNVDRFNFPLAYCGLPRTISGLLSISCANATMLRGPAGMAVGAVVIVIVAALNLVPIPYMTHRGNRKMQLWVKVLAISFLVLPLASFFFARRYTFDILFVYSVGYTLGGWIPLSRQERAGFYAEYRRWNGVVATLK
jgi:phosphatidylserine synthase